MKKTVAFITALVLALVLGLAAAEGNRTELKVPDMGTLEDPAAGTTAELYPASLTGTGYTDELCLDIHRREVNGAWVDYLLLLEPRSNDGAAAEYAVTVGDIVHREYSEEGEITKEAWENRQIGGKATFSRNDRGDITVSFMDEREEDLNDMKLEMAYAPAPEAEEIVRKVLLPIAELETDTVGAELKRAALTAELISFASQNGLFGVKSGEMEKAVKEAADTLKGNGDAYGKFVENAPSVAAMIRGLAGLTVEDPEEYEEIMALAEDAGAGEILQAGLKGHTDQCSAEVLAGALEKAAK